MALVTLPFQGEGVKLVKPERADLKEYFNFRLGQLCKWR